ncbi:MAG: FtsW/RodA/SpoVE family cell cycle protein, partial [Deltaproteobacteria bacterium]|nr:FtsW/RodA/SpoVE family cell cycle protein [Deltaproteobacteria bacterium]
MKPARVAWAQLHWPLVAVTLLIALAGIYNLHSSAAARDPSLYLVQLAVLGVGLVCVSALVAFDYRVTESLAYPGYAVACLFLVAVLFHGEAAKGAQRWLAVGPLSFQPSELAKLAVILCLARYFSQRAEPGGYTMRSLFRPLNLSRPLVALGLLIATWRKPLLSD